MESRHVRTPVNLLRFEGSIRSNGSGACCVKGKKKKKTEHWQWLRGDVQHPNSVCGRIGITSGKLRTFRVMPWCRWINADCIVVTTTRKVLGESGFHHRSFVILYSWHITTLWAILRFPILCSSCVNLKRILGKKLIPWAVSPSAHPITFHIQDFRSSALQRNRR